MTGAPKVKTVVKADRLIDGTGAPAQSDAAPVIEDGRISGISTQDSIDQSSWDPVETIDVAGGTVMPGFVEMHSHIHRTLP